MIHVAIGTKAQFIKMAPIMQRMKEKEIPFNLIDLGQHSLITASLRKEFSLEPPQVSLGEKENISHFFYGLRWMGKLFLKGFLKKYLKKEVFRDKKGVCLIHGDTASTLIALYLGKCAGIKVAHIEAGLRSFHYQEPFPEEIIRLIAMKFSDILFAPSLWARENLRKMGEERKSFLLSANTSWESTFYSLKKNVDPGLNLEKYCLVTVHRMENIFSKKKMMFILELIFRLTKILPVVFIQHHPTLNRIKKLGIEKRFCENPQIHLFKILSHSHFIGILNRCEFVITDGGSIQEESFYLDKPCLLLRNYTERMEGLGENVLLSKFSPSLINLFLKNYKKFKRRGAFSPEKKPSEEILTYLSSFI